MFLPTAVLGSLWGASFISTSYAINRTTAAGYISTLFFGWIIGSPLFGMFSDRLGLRKPPMYIGTVAALICLICIIYLPMPLFTLGALFFCLGLFSSGFLPSFSVILEINTQKENATALGFMNTMNMIGPVLLQPLIGYILDMRWSGKMIEGVRTYSLSEYHTALAIIPICVFISLLVLPFVRETRCQRLSA
jgi:MFS family permease